jgi:hypothetical protein
MMTQTSETLRIATFATADEAELALRRLFTAGFTRSQIVVICSNGAVQRRLGELDVAEVASPSSETTEKGIHTLSEAIGGLAAVAAAIGSADGSAAFSSGIANWTTGLIDQLTGAIAQHGVKQQLASHYAKLTSEGMILIGVEETGSVLQPNLDLAEQILSDSGAIPVNFSASSNE